MPDRDQSVGVHQLLRVMFPASGEERAASLEQLAIVYENLGGIDDAGLKGLAHDAQVGIFQLGELLAVLNSAVALDHDERKELFRTFSATCRQHAEASRKDGVSDVR